jgi:hypothetical protein
MGSLDLATRRRARRPPWARGTLALAVALVATAPGAADPRNPGHSRVRAVSPTLVRALETGYAYSATFRKLVDSLDRSDVVVHVEWGATGQLSGALRLAGTAGRHRYVRVVLNPLVRSRDLIVALGHELYHAAEIAAAPEVVDADTLAALFARIGRRTPGGYETAEARRASARIAAELAQAAEASYVLELTLMDDLEGPP